MTQRQVTQKQVTQKLVTQKVVAQKQAMQKQVTQKLVAQKQVTQKQVTQKQVTQKLVTQKQVTQASWRCPVHSVRPAQTRNHDLLVRISFSLVLVCPWALKASSVHNKVGMFILQVKTASQAEAFHAGYQQAHDL